MRFFLLLAALAAVQCLRSVEDDRTAFDKWTVKYEKNYKFSYATSEYSQRFACFQQNLDEIDRVTSLKLDDEAVYTIDGPFSDLCHAEFKAMYAGYKKSTTTETKVLRFSDGEVAKAISNGAVDWRPTAVTPVKNQASCGSCWSFSTTGNMEGQWYLNTSKLISLSEQMLVSCAPKPNQACQGGDMGAAMAFVTQNGGITSEANYPYTSGRGIVSKCDTTKLADHVAKFSSHVMLPQDESQMLAFVSSKGPLSIAVDAGLLWQLYGGGIKTTCMAGQPDHGVLIVGYGTSGSTQYWIVKNSWSSTWGEKGYIRLKYGVNCNSITYEPSSAIV